MDELEKDTRFKRELAPPDFLDQKIMQYARDKQHSKPKLLIFPQILKLAAAVALIFTGYLLSSIQQPDIEVIEPISLAPPVTIEQEMPVSIEESIDLLDAELFYLEMDLQADLFVLTEI